MNKSPLTPFALEAYLADRKRDVEEHLFASLPAAETQPAILAEAMRHAVLSGGKRLRPILCLAAAEAAGGSAADACCAATAVELLHTYTLVHDDLPCMDNDLLRRGQPTVHARYGEAVAVLTGDALQTLAFEVLASTPERRTGTVARLVKELAAAAGAAGVIAGQVEDIRYAAAPTRAVIDFVFQHKTADLFKAACRLGAIAAGGDDDTAVDRLARFADGLGFAFQIVDDLLDAQEALADGTPELSCLAVMPADAARDWARSLTAQAVDALDGLPGETAPLAALADRLLTRII
ncbi:MAG TPA: polyprenyl synthetase family protein [Kiritimatiellia bacterium]|jgi:geranylgeranyl pyrophosphate synthase|nr:MAG: Farnesyl diphosphate synthase [Verrucomicrobia bacterium ADurb.Bin070]HQL52003.1 polyprenyl synthetase family protein [Kiritimatiellia bacterium]HQQ92398.1 polyprenyl synthetase family protein [Kiritimatiellia bacterium]